MCKLRKKQMCMGDAIVICDCNPSAPCSLPIKLCPVHHNRLQRIEPQYMMVPVPPPTRHHRHSRKHQGNRAQKGEPCPFRRDSETDTSYEFEEYRKPSRRIFPNFRSVQYQRRDNRNGVMMESPSDQTNLSPGINYNIIFERIDKWGEITSNLIEKLSKDLGGNRYENFKRQGCTHATRDGLRELAT
ncbi:unnamed protein product [Nezara viridula]|uniref:Uncharacterized protein n=1 Tax=Nezara viridula TaxID=85310 RepID=A0A9P0HCP6_NEZVI|nr:unnamed protein product [Nezara viridula]